MALGARSPRRVILLIELGRLPEAAAPLARRRTVQEPERALRPFTLAAQRHKRHAYGFRRLTGRYLLPYASLSTAPTAARGYGVLRVDRAAHAAALRTLAQPIQPEPVACLVFAHDRTMIRTRSRASFVQ